MAVLAQREEELGVEPLHALGQHLLLVSIDDLWTEHLTNLERVEEGIGLQGYAQQDPLVAWRREAGLMYGELMFHIRSRTVDLWFMASDATATEPDPTGAAELRVKRKQ